VAKHAGKPWTLRAKIRWALGGLPLLLLVAGFIAARETHHPALGLLCLGLTAVVWLAELIPSLLALRRDASGRGSIR
jgi:hypothetical protein